ncbi:cytochrome P450, partial [Lentinula edodes]
LNAIPTVGPTGFLSGFVGPYQFFTNAKDIPQEGYEKARLFVVALVDRWAIIAPGCTMVEDLMKATDDQLSIIGAAAETLQVEYTLKVVLHPYHVAMTRNIATRFAEVRDETVSAFADLIPLKDDWVKVPADKTSFQIVGRTANSFFAGLPLCRHSDWLDLNTNFAVEIFICAMTINLFPSFLKPIAGRFLTRMQSSTKRATKHLALIIEERLAREDEYGTKDWPGQPRKHFRLLDEEKVEQVEQREVSDLIKGILVIEVAAIHTTTFCNALYQLAPHPELVVLLREEVEAIAEKSVWTKEGVGKMRQLDSFLKEILGFSGGGGIVNSRTVFQDFTSLDGTSVPAATTIGVAAYMHHHD